MSISKRNIKKILIAVTIILYLCICFYPGGVFSKYSIGRVGKHIENIPLLENHSVEQNLIFDNSRVRSLGITIGEKDEFASGVLVYEVLDENREVVYRAEEAIQNFEPGVIKWEKVDIRVEPGKLYSVKLSVNNLNGMANIAALSEEKGIKECNMGLKFDDTQYDGLLAINVAYELGVSNVDRVRFLIYAAIIILLILYYEKLSKYKIWVTFGIASYVILDVCYTSVLPLEDIICKNLFFFICIVYILFSAIQAVLYVKGIRKIEVYFLLMAVLWGILYNIVVYPLNAQDEEVHFAASYALSSVMMNEPVLNDKGYLIVRNGDQKEVEEIEENDNGEHKYVKMSKFFSRINEKAPNKGEYTIYAPDNSAIVNAPVYDYIFSAIGITIARMLNLNYFWLVYIGRMMNLIVYMVIMYYAVKIAPYGKLFLLNLSQIPLLLVRVSTFNYDLLIIALCALLVTLVMKTISEQKEMNKREKILILFFCVIISTLKRTLYFPILFIVLFIPNYLISAKKKNAYIYKIVLVLVSAVIAYLIAWRGTTLNLSNLCYAHIGDTKGISIEYYEEELSVDENDGITLVNRGEFEYFNVPYFINNPFLICKRIAYTMFKDLDEYILRVFGDATGAPYYIMIYFALSFFVTLSNENRDKISNTFVFVAIAIPILYWLILMCASMIEWNSVTDLKGIWGPQGRYLYPLLPLCIMMCRKKKMVVTDLLEKYISITCIVQLLSVLTILFTIWKKY